MTNWKIHPDAPTDENGNPVHPDPDKTHHICGRTKSERTTETSHGRERDDHPYCLLRAGYNTSDPKRLNEPGVACSHHGGNNSGPTGEDNGAYKHGAYSKYLKSDLSENEQAVFDEVAENGWTKSHAKEMAAEALIKYKRSGDERFLRRWESICEKFNLIDSTDKIEVSGPAEAMMLDVKAYHEGRDE